MIKNKRILVTGGAGFIGSNLIKKLVESRNKIHIIIRESTNLWRLKNFLPGLSIHYCNIQDLNSTKKIINQIKPDIIFHLATHGAYSNQTNIADIIKTNILGTTNLLLALNPINYRCFINTGSSSEYGFKTKPMKESDSLEPISFYAAAKASTTYLCKVFAKTFNKPIITFRPFSVYGPYEEPTRLVPTMITRILIGKPVELTSKEARRDFIFINDVVDCYINSVSYMKRKIYGEIFNVGTGKQHSNEEVVNIITKILKQEVKINKGTYQNRVWDTNFWVADNAKTKKLLHWNPKYTLKSGLLETIKWFKNYEDKSGYYQKT